MVKVYIFELSLPICEKNRSLLLSELDSSEINTLPSQEESRFDLSLIGQIFAKKIVSDEAHILKKDILIGKTKLGKPIIKSPSSLNIDISISHSGNYLTVGICDSGEIGVDLEILNNIDFEKYGSCLSASEEKYVSSGKEAKKRLENFYEIWTRKESYLKTLGVGLQRPLPITQFYSGDIKPRNEFRHNNQKYYISTLKEDEFVLSVCTTSKQTKHDQIYTKLTSGELLPFITESEVSNLNIHKTNASFRQVSDHIL